MRRSHHGPRMSREWPVRANDAHRRQILAELTGGKSEVGIVAPVIVIRIGSVVGLAV